jgi:serine/threonine protein kinase
MAVIMGKFKIESEIGRGAYATVYSARAIQPYPPLNVGDFLALKSISTARISSQHEQEKLENEIALMKTLDHPNIVKLFGAERVRGYYFLVMEYCGGGDLIHHLRSLDGGLSEDTIRQFMGQVGEGLKYLHSHQIVHRDLKPHNILLCGPTESPTLKIADFGFARFLRPQDLAETICGSPIYMAPEVQFGIKYSANVDMWSLGVIIYEMITTKTPFPSVRTQYELSQELKTIGSKPISLPLSAQVSQELRELVSLLLTVDQERRMNLDQFLSHPFMTSRSANPESAGAPSAPSERMRRFSFLAAEGIIDEQKAESLLVEAQASAEIIAVHLSNSQKIGGFLVFELLTVLCEFLLDFLYEYRRSTETPNADLENSIIETVSIHAGEANEYLETDLKPSEVSAFQFLFEQGIEYAKSGAEAERSGDSFALLRYQRAMAMLKPIVYSLGSDGFITSVRDLFVQLSKRSAALSARSSLDV